MFTNLSPERHFTIKANFNAHVDKVYDLIRLDYTELLTIIPNENPTVEQVKSVALELFQSVATMFRISSDKDEFGDRLSSFASIFIITGLMDGDRTGAFFGDILEIVQQCFQTTKALIEAPNEECPTLTEN